MSPMPGRRPLLRTEPSSLERTVRDIARRTRKIERAPTRQVFTATPVAVQPIPPSPAATGGILFLAIDDDGFYYLYGYRNGVWSDPTQLTTIDASGIHHQVLQKTAGKHFILSSADILYVSDDAGLTWASAMSGLPDLDMFFEFLSLDGVGDTFYVFRYGTNYEVYKSTDGAASWTLVQDISDADFINGDTLQIAVNPNDADNVILMGLNASRTQMTIGYSTDGLGTYTKVAVTPTPGTDVSVGNIFEYQVMRFTPDGSRVVMMADIIDDLPGVGNQIWYFGAYWSDDGGATWDEILNETLPERSEFGGSDPNLGPLLTQGGGLMFACGCVGSNVGGLGVITVWMSQDAGETWTELPCWPLDADTNVDAFNSGGRIVYDATEDILYAHNLGGGGVSDVLKMANPTGASPTWVDITPSGMSATRSPVYGQALALA